MIDLQPAISRDFPNSRNRLKNLKLGLCRRTSPFRKWCWCLSCHCVSRSRNQLSSLPDFWPRQKFYGRSNLIDREVKAVKIYIHSLARFAKVYLILQKSQHRWSHHTVDWWNGITNYQISYPWQKLNTERVKARNTIYLKSLIPQGSTRVHLTSHSYSHRWHR
jgi:hypothetical protein